MNFERLKNRKISILRVFWTILWKTENTRVLKGYKSLKALGFIGKTAQKKHS